MKGFGKWKICVCMKLQKRNMLIPTELPGIINRAGVAGAVLQKTF